MRKSWLSILFLITVAVFWWGCSDKPTESGTGQLRLTLIDAPAAVDQVTLYVDRVEVHRADADSNSGWYVVNDSPGVYNLLDLQNGVTAVLGDTALPTGMYTQIRLIVADSCTVVIDGVPYPLDIPSQTGLKLNHPFSVSADELTALTLDFNVEKSIHEYQEGMYRLTPVIRIVSDVISGTISGLVTPFEAQVTAADLDDTISTWTDLTTGAFKLMALPAGTYDVTIVPNDTLYADSTIVGVSVVAGQDTDLGSITLPLK